MARRHVAPARLRIRLTIAFVLVAGISSGALAVGSYVLVRQARLSDSLERASADTARDLRAAQGFHSGEEQNLLQGIESTTVHAIFVQPGSEPQPSNASFDPRIPAALRALVSQGNLAYQRIAFRPPGRPAAHFLLVGGLGPPAIRGSQLYLLFSEDRIFRDLDQLRDVLAIGWVVVLLLATAVGRTLARRTLAPIGRASEAARAMAAGELDTRLPAEGRDEFAAWATSFNAMADALETKINQLSDAQARELRFTSDVSHELRTPVAALVGEASLLKEHLDRMPSDAGRVAQLVINDVSRLRRLVDELMEISRLDAGRDSLEIGSVHVQALLEAVIRSRGWISHVELAGDDLILDTDRRRLERIVANLIGNAIEHGAGSPVRVRVGRDGDGATIQISDRGPGIPSEHVSHVFERFYKADPSRSQRGSGLGLAIALENSRLLGGDIEVRSELGAGSQFTVRLPIGPPVTERLPAGESGVSASTDDRRIGPSQGDRT